MKTSVIIPAAGQGKRFGSEKPKQYLEIGGEPILIKTIKLFDRIDDVEDIVVTVHNEWFAYAKELVKKYDCKKVKEITIGGKERQDSVYAGLNLKSVQDSELILIHDAVRPFTSANLIQKIINTAEEYGAAIPAISINDTIKQVSNRGFVEKTLDRTKLMSIQTPQAYWADIITDAYKKGRQANFEGTDSASFVEFFGYKVYVVDGDQHNLKITNEVDLQYALVAVSE